MKPQQSVATLKTTGSQSTYELKRKAREKQYEKIKEYAVQFNVDEAMIYALLSEYKGMQKINLDEEEGGHSSEKKFKKFVKTKQGKKTDLGNNLKN